MSIFSIINLLGGRCGEAQGRGGDGFAGETLVNFDSIQLNQPEVNEHEVRQVILGH